MQEYVRWYDKNLFLSSFMVLMENLPVSVQEEVAVDIILNISALKKQKCDTSFNLEGDNILACNRWYDQNSAVHYAVKMLQGLTDVQRDNMIKSASDIIVKYGIDNSLFNKYESFEND